MDQMDVEAVILEYRDALRRFLLSRLRDPNDADDVLQEVLTKTFRTLDTLKSEDSVRPWLFRIAHNALTDHYRRTARDAGIDAADLWYGQMDSEAEHAFAPCVDSFLNALPDDAARLLRAVELEGVSQKDYAAQIGVSYSTVKSRVQASRRKLRSLFEQCCDIAFATDGSILEYRRKDGGCTRC